MNLTRGWHKPELRSSSYIILPSKNNAAHQDFYLILIFSHLFNISKKKKSLLEILQRIKTYLS